MKIKDNKIIITTVYGDSETVRVYRERSDVRDILNDVEAAIVNMYDRSSVVFEEFIECGELEITGLPLQLQVVVFAELKDQIDGDDIFIENRDQKFPCMRLDDYLLLGPGQDICGAIADTLEDLKE